MNKRPMVFLLHGFLGAGKTTFAKRLEQEHHAIRFTPDEWMSKLYGNDPPEAFFNDYSRRVSEIMESRWVYSYRTVAPAQAMRKFGRRARSVIEKSG